MADTKLVMTVAPQKDIWPHGSTYPRNAVAIRIKKIKVPVIHTDLDLNEENIMPRAM